jgi:ketosteroid isomerase-like protein
MSTTSPFLGRRSAVLAALAVPAVPAFTGCALRLGAASREQRLAQVRAAEIEFADTMARRDVAAFASFIAEDAVFINGGSPLRGKAAILDHWKRFFSASAAPFAWRPEIVEVTAAGELGYTEGPVVDPAGAAFAKFYSTWRLQPSGRWLVVFDNGYSLCKPSGG